MNDERRTTNYERRGAPPRPEPNVTEIRERDRVSLLAALLFFVGLGAGALAILAGLLFFWPWMIKAAEWVGWVVGRHPGLVMVGLLVVAVGAMRLARWVDERSQDER